MAKGGGKGKKGPNARGPKKGVVKKAPAVLSLKKPKGKGGY